MSRPTWTTGYAEKSIYLTPLSSDGQHQVVSTGCVQDVYGEVEVQASGVLDVQGTMAMSGTNTVSGTVTATSDATHNIGGPLRWSGTKFASSNSAALRPNRIHILHTSEDITWRLLSPTTFHGSWVKCVFCPTTNPAADNAVVRLATSKGTYFNANGQMLTFTTQKQFVGVSRWVELVGTTQLKSTKKSWIVASAGPLSTGLPYFTVSTSTA